MIKTLKGLPYQRLSVMSELKDAFRNGALAGIGMGAVTQGAGMIAYTALGIPM